MMPYHFDSYSIDTESLQFSDVEIFLEKWNKWIDEHGAKRGTREKAVLETYTCCYCNQSFKDYTKNRAYPKLCKNCYTLPYDRGDLKKRRNLRSNKDGSFSNWGPA